MKSVYFDNAATTAMRDEVIEVMSYVMKNNYGNASSSYSLGRLSKSIIETSRKTIAKVLNASPGEIIFTSSGTEADNLVLRSAVRDLGVKHIITSKIEHHAVLHTVNELEREYGVKISYLDLDEYGVIDFDQLESLLKKHKNVLVSLMHVNNEIGNILDIKRVGDLCKANRALFHSDAVQSIGHYRLDVQESQVDFLAASAHKFHGPKGVGFAFIRKNSGLKPLIFGGEQERGLRAGTESVHNIAGLEKAMSMSYDNLESEVEYVQNLKSYFVSKLKKAIPDIEFNGLSEDLEKSTYTLLNLRLPIDPNKSAMFLFQLDLKGIACSKGSACQSGSNQKSHVLKEILNADELEKPSIRFSLSVFNTKQEIDYVVGVLKSLTS
ncbi:cysteine desulfurase [Hyunsoonleella sp. SJ7]|uniref:cysteine desulfurase n=1 Tax=Hyunsoonleella aquatilis TaxID=2762758 RepID=A0A923HAG4_9FLAO|nr:cysteine desulfurase family protein [Hyunsoonleella aquatilis]MBC3758749.1 cysteine desulfurase [Hyunsoonleella aquatilis]